MALIFVVDDHQDSCRVMGKVLGYLGHQATCFESGEAMLAGLEVDLPDAIILDLMMPEMDGLEVLSIVKSASRTADVKVIIHSATADPRVVRTAKARGAAAIWHKGALELGQVEQELGDLLGAAAGSGH